MLNRSPLCIPMPAEGVCLIDELDDLVDESDDTDLRSERTRIDASPAERFRGSLSDTDAVTWLRLVALAEAAGKRSLADAFRSAARDELPSRDGAR